MWKSQLISIAAGKSKYHQINFRQTTEKNTMRGTEKFNSNLKIFPDFLLLNIQRTIRKIELPLSSFDKLAAFIAYNTRKSS